MVNDLFGMFVYCNTVINTCQWNTNIWLQNKNYIKGNTGLDRESAHPLQLNTRKPGYRKDVNLGVTVKFMANWVH